MKKIDGEKFFKELQSVAAMHSRNGEPMPAEVAARYWNALQAYSLQDVLAAMAAHDADKDRGKYMPKPADLIHQLERRRPNPRPSADEAWPMLPFDESQSAAWTGEMAEAWGIAAACMPDKVAARMAFRAAYERLCQQADDRGEPVRWSVTLGTDKASRQQVIDGAVRKGRITQEYATAMLPAPQASMQETVKLLETQADDSVRKAAIADLRKLLRGKE